VTVLVAGPIVGIALGLLLIVAWERVDPRIDRPEDLSREVGSPTSPVSEISEAGANALIARWKALAEPGPSTIALVPVTADVQADLSRVALKFSQVGGNGNGAEPPCWDRTHHRIDGREGLTQPSRSQAGHPRIGQPFADPAVPIALGHTTALPPQPGMEPAEPAHYPATLDGGPAQNGNSTPMVIACEVPSADLTALQSIMDCDLVVLVARKGTPRATLRELLESLTEFGVSPKWAIFLDSRPTEAAAVPEAR